MARASERRGAAFRSIVSVTCLAAAGCGGGGGGGSSSGSSSSASQTTAFTPAGQAGALTAPTQTPMSGTATTTAPQTGASSAVGPTTFPGSQIGTTAPGTPAQPAPTPVQGSSSSHGSSGQSVGAAVAGAVGSLIGSLISQAIQQPKIAALGQALFHDKILSGNRDVACSTCHNEGSNLGDGLSLSFGTGGSGVGPSRQQGSSQMTSRHAPALFGVGSSGYGGSSSSFFWDARVTFSPLSTPDAELVANTTNPDYAKLVGNLGSAMAAQAMFPVLDQTEMRGAPGTNEIANAPDNVTAWKLLMARLVGTQNGTVGGIQGYRDLFSNAFPGVAFDDMTFAHAATALAAYVGQSFNASNTPYDQYQNGTNPSAMSASQLNGMTLFFGKANCGSCHSGNAFSDFAPHGMAAPQLGPGRFEAGNDRGVALVSGNAADNYKFRTPSLRNVAISGPWTHSGAYTTLEGAVRHMLDPRTGLTNYDVSQVRSDFAATLDTDPGRQAARLAAIDPVAQSPVSLSNSEVSDLVNFLGALTDPSSVPNAQGARPSSVPSGLPID